MNRIPRTQIRGLIEARPTRSCTMWRSAIPRTQIRGLIEASGEPTKQQRKFAIPRTQIRGLIEAHQAVPRVPLDRPGFRGLRSAASLKRARAAPARPDPLPIPRTQIRGLIEAARRAFVRRPAAAIPRTQIRGLIEARVIGWGSGSGARFRGLRSAASLKPSARAARPQRGPRFRGLRSAASLKRPRRPRPASVPIGIPRTQIRGLIEARSTTAEAPSSSRIPRTQIRGLIEAGTRSSSPSGKTGLDSADSDPRPH